MTRNDTPTAATLADGLADPALHQGGDPWEVWRALRGAPGLAWTRESDGPGFWSATRHADVARLLADSREFSSVPGTTLEGDRWLDDPAANRMLPLMDPPLHALVRGHIAADFTAGRGAALVQSCRAEIERLADQAIEQGHVDIDAAFGIPLPSRLTLALFGIPTADAPMLARIIGGTLSCDETDRAIADAEMILYLQELIDARRRSPGSDLISRLCTTPALTDLLPGEGLLLTIANLMAAGLTTTRLAINGAFEAFARHPDQWRMLRAEPALRKTAIEEVLRWTSPALAVVRTAVVPMQLAGTVIAPGARVVAWLPSANRDEAAFPHADRFMVARSGNTHLGFGTGIHRCLGMAFARLELGMLIAVTSARWGDLALAREPLRFRSLVLHGNDRVELAVSGADA